MPTPSTSSPPPASAFPRPIFSYTSFGALLGDYVAHQKRTVGRRWTLSRWSRELGLAGPSMLTMVIKGERNPGESLVSAICRSLRVSGKEEGYLRDLVELRRARRNERERALVTSRLAQYRPPREVTPVSREVFLAVSRWHYYAIREMVSLASFREDPDWISRRLQFPVTPVAVRDAIRTLLKVKLLARDADGKLVPACGHVETTSEAGDEGIKRFHEQSLENARESVRKHPPSLRELYGTTFVLRRDRIAEAKERIRKFHREFCREFEVEGGDDVYQLEIGLFPLTLGEVET